MDHKYVVSDLHHNQLPQISGWVSTSQQIPPGIFTDFDPGNCMFISVPDIVIRNPVPTGRMMDL